MSHRHDPQQLNQPGVPKDEFALEEIIREFSPKKKRAPQSKLSDDTMAFTPVTAQSRPPEADGRAGHNGSAAHPGCQAQHKARNAARARSPQRAPRIPCVCRAFRTARSTRSSQKQSEKKAAALTSDTMRLPDLKTLNAALAEQKRAAQAASPENRTDARKAPVPQPEQPAVPAPAAQKAVRASARRTAAQDAPHSEHVGLPAASPRARRPRAGTGAGRRSRAV